MSEVNDNVKIHIFEGKNFKTWKIRLHAILAAKDCKEVIDVDDAPEGTTAAQWTKKKAKAKNIIINSLADTRLEAIDPDESPK